MTAMAIRGVGVCAGGMRDWAGASAVLRGATAFLPGPAEKRPVEGLPQTEQRRINETSRLACLAAADAVALLARDAAATLPAVFASSDGDGAVLMQMLNALAQRDVVLSPTAFHNSVYNAPAGYWSIATRASAPSTTLCADAASLAVALLEGQAQARESGGPVLVVAVDAPFPDAIRVLGASAAPFACALVLEDAVCDPSLPRIEGWTIVEHAGSGEVEDAPDALGGAFAGNAAAVALPLLRALARRQPTRVALPYLDGTSLLLDVAP